MNLSMTNQELAVQKLSRLKVGALFMETGTGKTKTAMDLIASKKEKIDYILWICPFSVKGEIESERMKWHPELKIDIVGCETISQSDSKYMDILSKTESHKSFVVVDESLKIKNKDAKRTKRIMEIGKHAEYRLILNGTPLSKNVLDLYTQMEFLSPKILNMSYNQFKNQYCEYYIRGRLKNKVKSQWNIENLISLINPYIFDSELDIRKDKNRKSVGYSIDDLNGYENIKRRFIDFDTDISFFALANALQHHYCSQLSKKAIVKKLTECTDEQTIVFVKFLDSIPDGSNMIIGSMNAKEREKEISDFKAGKTKTLYMTYGCGSFGLNLQNCHRMIFADHTFDYAERLQSEARIYRMGQESSVEYIDVNCDCGLDKLIRGCLAKKVKLLDEVKNEIEKKGWKEWLKNI